MWCAGEIYFAVTYHINIVPVVCCSGFVYPSDAFLDTDLEAVWSDAQKGTLLEFFVTIEKIKSAYKMLRRIDREVFAREASLIDQEANINTILGRCVGLSRRVTISSNGTSEDAVAAVITGNTDDLEAVCTCAVIARQLQRQMEIAVKVVRSILDMQASVQPELKYFIWVLTRGVLENDRFAECLSYTKELIFMPIAADTSFVYPDAMFYDKLLAGDILRLDAPVVKQHGLKWVYDAYKAIFLVISSPFSPPGSTIIQNAEVKMMCKRLPRLHSKIIGAKETDGQTRVPVGLASSSSCPGTIKWL